MILLGIEQWGDVMKFRFVYIFSFCLIISSDVFAIDPVYEGENGILAKVFSINCLFCHSSEKTGSSRNGAPSHVNLDTYEAALEYADRAIIRAVNEMSMPPIFSVLPGLNQEQKAAMLAWQQAGFPKFSTQATFDFSTQMLNLPIMVVGDLNYRVELRLIEISSSAFGVGFELVSAHLTELSSESAAMYNPETGVVQMPDIHLLNHNDISDKVSAQMLLIPDTDILQFELTELVLKK